MTFRFALLSSVALLACSGDDTSATNSNGEGGMMNLQPVPCAAFCEEVGEMCQYAQMSIDRCTTDCEQAIEAPDTEANWRQCAECSVHQSSCDNFNSQCMLDTPSGPESCGGVFIG